MVSTPRNDSLAQAATLLEKLDEEGSALPQKPSIHLALNQVRSLGERIGVAGQANAWIGYDERMAEHLDGRLAEPLMGLLYPNWSPRKSRSSGKRRYGEKGKSMNESFGTDRASIFARPPKRILTGACRPADAPDWEICRQEIQPSDLDGIKLVDEILATQ